MADPTDPVIPFSRFRAALARTRRTRRADALVADPDAARLVPALPVQELYYAIKEVGLADAEELVALASPAQVQGFLDLDVWDRDTLDVDRMSAWLEALVTAGPEKLGAAVDALDAELIALYLQRQARVYDLTLEGAPEEPEGHFYPTPDRFFILDILVEGERAKALARVIDWLYRADLELARRVVMSAKWELGSDLEEWSHRWRAGRLGDLGFVDFYEALGIYRYLDPATVRLDEGTADRRDPEGPMSALPALYAGSLKEAGFFGRALATLEHEDEIERLGGALVTLVNKAMSADRVEPGDPAAAEAALGRVVATLGLGLEYLGRGDADRGREALEEIALERVFRVGHSLLLQLKRLADVLWEKGRVRGARGELYLDPPYDEILEALRRPRPLYPRVLDGAPGPATATSKTTAPSATPASPGMPTASATRPFATLADVQRAARALETAARVPALVYDGFGVDEAELAKEAPPGAHFGTVVRTLGAHALIDGAPTAALLERAELPALRARLADPARARASIEHALRMRLAERGFAAPPDLEQLFDVWLGDFAAASTRPDGLLVRFV